MNPLRGEKNADYKPICKPNHRTIFAQDLSAFLIKNGGIVVTTIKCQRQRNSFQRKNRVRSLLAATPELTRFLS